MENYTEINEKFADLLLRKCLNGQEKLHDRLLVIIDLKETLEFANIVKDKALELGYKDVISRLEDQDEIHDFLSNNGLEEIKNSSLFDRSILEEFSKTNAPILWIVSSVPGLMSDIDSEKLNLVAKVRNESASFYRANIGKRIFPWSLTRFPNVRWAKSVFGDSEDAYDKLYNAIAEACMLDRDDPIGEWDKFIESSNSVKNNLNNLEISSLHFKNGLGTDLTIGLPKGYCWLNLDKGQMLLTICLVMKYLLLQIIEKLME